MTHKNLFIWVPPTPIFIFFSYSFLLHSCKSVFVFGASLPWLSFKCRATKRSHDAIKRNEEEWIACHVRMASTRKSLHLTTMSNKSQLHLVPLIYVYILFSIFFGQLICWSHNFLLKLQHQQMNAKANTPQSATTKLVIAFFFFFFILIIIIF